VLIALIPVVAHFVVVKDAKKWRFCSEGGKVGVENQPLVQGFKRGEKIEGWIHVDRVAEEQE